MLTEIDDKPPLPDPPDPFKPKTCMTSSSESKLHSLLSSHKSTFDEPTSITTVGPLHRIHLKPDAQPKHEGLRRMSPAELTELSKLGAGSQALLELGQAWDGSRPFARLFPAGAAGPPSSSNGP